MADLTTLTKVKSYLGISNTTYDTILSSLITSVSAEVESICGRTFGSASHTEYFDTDGETKIFIQNYPIRTLTSVKYRSGDWANPTYTAYVAGDYLANNDIGKISFAGRFPTAEKYLEIVYTGGYLIDFTGEGTATHTLPYDLTQIVTEAVAQKYNTRSTQGISNMSTEGQSITYSSSMSFSKDLQNKLQRYINYKC